jgi:AAA15 family ATPase/GTPase
MRIKSLSIQDFRGFRRFDMKDIGRINLIVGTNNCGKTTVLEAINVLMASGDGYPIWSILSRRGEDVWPERDGVTVYGSMSVRLSRYRQTQTLGS